MPILARYAVSTFGWTWTVWWTAVFAERASAELPLPLIVALGGLGPAVGSAFVIRGSDEAYQREFIRRLWDPKRIPGSWWLALVAVAVVPALAGYLVAVAVGRPPVGDTTVTFGSVALIVGFGLAAGAVEEPGWRGAALDLLQTRTSSLVAAIFIGIQWAFWHLPLFFIEGTYQHALGFGSARFWLFNVFLLLLSVLYVWLCNGSRGSILVAILAHAGTNIAGSLIPQDTLSDIIRCVVTSLAVIVVVWLTHGDLRFHKSHVRRAPTQDHRS